jgi:Flp pilus assembly pilin Flp
MLALIKRGRHDESGSTNLEYALIAVLISVFIIGAAESMSTSLGRLFNTVETSTANALNKV